jgi:hypothetical protein
MDSENYLVNLHQFPLPDASIKVKVGNLVT